MLLLTCSSLPRFQIGVSGGLPSCQDSKCDFSVFSPTLLRRRRCLFLPVRWWASVRHSSSNAFLVFYPPSMHTVIDLHGRMSEVEASVEASGHYPLQARRHPERKDTRIQITGNQQHGKWFIVKSDGGSEVALGPQIQFFLCLCVTGRNR